IWAGILALANQGRAEAGMSPLGSDADPTATLKALYSAPTSAYNDIDSGFNGYHAGTGYDLVGGIGSPAAGLIPSLIAYNTPIEFGAYAGNATVTPQTLAD